MTTNELTQQKNNVKPLEEEVITRLVLDGDIRGLKPAQKVQYYRAICERLGLDAATQPFKILKLQGGEQLYCTRSGAQQLNRKHRIGHAILAREIVNECYVVTARATGVDGRFEESIGAVSIAGLKGEALCNAMMKAETKSKRRSTLDLCGLGIPDESELGEWSAKGQTTTIEEEAKQPVVRALPKSQVAALREEMKAVEGEGWKDVICTYGKKDGNILGKTLGHISHFAPVVMDSLYSKFVDPQELKVIQEKDQPLRQGLIVWESWKRLQESWKRLQEEKWKAFEARRQEEVNKSWDEDDSDSIPMDYPEPEKPF